MKLNATLLFLAISIFIFSKTASAIIHEVPSDFSTIQEAINAAVNGDTIVVATGSYYENLNFKGKNIVLTSNYYLAGDTSFINKTIINGSQPANIDTGSCVIFASGEDSTAVLMGFTITGGTGTVWLDAHGAGTYREGGGILIDFSSPTIRNNRIVDNLATNSTGINGAGGGGIRISDGNPYMLNNLIAYNKAKYGPGVVLNYTGCIMRNNIIAYNSGGQTFNGGGAIWSNTNSAAYPKIIENNTIYRNQASVGTGGCLAWGGTLIMKNNILWGNYSADNSQVKAISGVATVTYCDVQGGYTGIGNTDVSPDFIDTTSFILNISSSCIDAGDTSIIFNDVEESAGSGTAKFPSQGMLRNDMGAYGGGGAALIPSINLVTGIEKVVAADFNLEIFPNPGNGTCSVTYFLYLPSQVEMKMMDVYGREIKELLNEKQPAGAQSFTLCEHIASGVYILQLRINKSVCSKLLTVQ